MTISIRPVVKASWQHFIERTEKALQFKKTMESHRVALSHAPTTAEGLPAHTHYLKWPNLQSPCVVIMAGGVVNIAHRFRFLAECLSNEFECIAFDWYGRGYSDWLSGQSDYGFKTNAKQASQLITQVDDGRPIVFVGSSLGGLVAMALPSNVLSRIKGLVLNDVGPMMPAARRTRRATALNVHRVFDEPAMLQQKLGVAEKNAGYFPQWVRDYLSMQNTVWHTEGQTRKYRYDMACMARYAQDANSNINLWPEWSRIQCPQLLIHGQQSDALSDQQVQKMCLQAGDRLTLIQIEGAGHTPSLCVPAQTDLILNWLKSICF